MPKNITDQFADDIRFMDLADQLMTLKHIAVKAAVAEYPTYNVEQIQIELKARGFDVAISSIVIAADNF